MLELVLELGRHAPDFNVPRPGVRAPPLVIFALIIFAISVRPTVLGQVAASIAGKRALSWRGGQPRFCAQPSDQENKGGNRQGSWARSPAGGMPRVRTPPCGCQQYKATNLLLTPSAAERPQDESTHLMVAA